MPGIVRFAPSPTGYLHEGHLLSALYVWAAALKWNLQVHLRIEDHDQGRARQEYIHSIRQDLAAFGFKYQSESLQSERWPLYQKVLQKLQEHHLIYPCTCSRKQLLAKNPKSETGEVIYQGKCRSKTLPCSDSHSLRLIIPDNIITWTDFQLGTFHENPAKQCGDIPLQDRDGFWTYQFAVCVDDLTQGITHIIRGKDILNSTARQIALSQIITHICGKDLGLPPYQAPLYLHHPLITDDSGKKLSKREHAHSLRQDQIGRAHV